MTNQAPGFEKHPGYHVTIEPCTHDIAVVVNGKEVGRTNKALVLKEQDYPDVYYFPIDVFPAGTIEKSDHSSYCPFKGDASYFHFTFDGKTNDNAIWSYQNPFDEALPIKDLVSIYSKVASIKKV
jgi:uncharacterized protein (DUF427 family)